MCIKQTKVKDVTDKLTDYYVTCSYNSEWPKETEEKGWKKGEKKREKHENDMKIKGKEVWVKFIIYVCDNIN